MMIHLSHRAPPSIYFAKKTVGKYVLLPRHPCHSRHRYFLLYYYTRIFHCCIRIETKHDTGDAGDAEHLKKAEKGNFLAHLLGRDGK